ncbi:MAG TPA: alpha/beta hydrolase, partial [Microbacterium sp.]|nr:alpha/beta hydrolase [Microbacterium sp.]
MHLPRYVREGGTPPLSDDPAGSGWRTVVIPTAVGDLTVRAGRRTGGTATVLLHGAAGTWTTWTPLAAYARDTGRTLENVVAVDLPGWGDSGELDPALHVEDVSHAIADLVRSLGYDDWIVAGHSLGGVVALDLAARAPGPTVGVVLVAPTGASVIDAIRHPLRGGMRLPGFAGMLAVMRALSAFGPGGAAIVEGVAAAGL